MNRASVKCIREDTVGEAVAEGAGHLVLGWRVDSNLNPSYWLEKGARPGAQPNSALVTMPAPSLGCHSAIIAQSGSGKSFFLGRLVEELLLATKARCVILDPNADFRRIKEVVSPTLWTNAGYDPREGTGFLPHEESAEVFREAWQRVSKSIYGGPELPTQAGKRLRLNWFSLSMNMLGNDLEPMRRSDLYHCHEFAKAITQLIIFKHGKGSSQHKEQGISVFDLTLGSKSSRQTRSKGEDSGGTRKRHRDLIDEASRALRRLRGMTAQEGREFLEDLFDADELDGRVSGGIKLWLFSITVSGAGQVRQLIERAIASSEHVSEEIARFYFGKAREYIAQGIVQVDGASSDNLAADSARIEVIDLPSFPDETRYLALNSVLRTIWEKARLDWANAMKKADSDDERVPTFVILDEAHNLIPRDNEDLAAKGLRDQFRSIAAEGRKYGLFLILCTQRPDKIDKFVLSECENRAIMRLGSQSVLDETRILLGLEDVPIRTLEKCLAFETGRALLCGRWAKDAPGQNLFVYTALRRTAEGGRNLRKQYWAMPAPLKEDKPNADGGSDNVPAEPTAGS
jgi:hypothetical protein